MRIPPLFLFAAIAAFAGNASADTMYKCTDPNGKVSYSDQPCAGKGKAATLKVVAPKRQVEEEDDDEDDQELSLQARKPKETELERLRRADAEFQERLRKREQADEEYDRMAQDLRRANERADKYKPKSDPVDPKQTTLTAPTWRQRQRAEQQRQQEEKRRRDALFPSSH